MTAWTQIGLMDLNWDRYVKYRILPDFFSTDLMILVNQKKWQSLVAEDARDPAARRDRARDLQPAGRCRRCGRRSRPSSTKRGIKTVAQSPEASKNFIAGARAASLQRMKERMEKAGGMENYDKVVKLFTPD